MAKGLGVFAVRLCFDYPSVRDCAGRKTRAWTIFGKIFKYSVGQEKIGPNRKLGPVITGRLHVCKTLDPKTHFQVLHLELLFGQPVKARPKKISYERFKQSVADQRIASESIIKIYSQTMTITTAYIEDQPCTNCIP